MGSRDFRNSADATWLFIQKKRRMPIVIRMANLYVVFPSREGDSRGKLGTKAPGSIFNIGRFFSVMSRGEGYL